MSLSLRLLPKLQVSRRQKFGLAAVFCLTGLVIVAAVLRVTQIAKAGYNEPVRLAVWTNVEGSISIVVGCMPPLKNLLGRAITSTIRSRRSHASPHDAEASEAQNYRTGSRSRKTESNTHGMKLQDRVSMFKSNHSHNSSKNQIVVRQDYGWVNRSESEVEADGPFGDEARIIHPQLAHRSVGFDGMDRHDWT